MPHLSLIVVGHVQTESAVPHLSLTPAERAATTTRILKFRISEFHNSDFQKSMKIAFQGDFAIPNSEIQKFRILAVVAAREWLATPPCSS